ncbi:hypothetical protein EIP86_009513 [Pleurotus ostreatoroseus]|nr:hypothetical protein EIP86_009513 [Pleurotus ostreatoroseus]
MSPLPRIPALSGAFIVPKRLIEKGPLTLVDFYDWNAEQNPEHPLFRFHDGSQITTICWKDAVRASHRAARFFSSSVIQQDATPPVVGILANTDTVTYFTSIMGMFRAGITVFTISTRNSAEAVRHLLTVTNTQYIFTSQEPAIVALAEAALESGPPVSTHHMPEFKDIYVADENVPYTYPSGTRDPDAPALILHSSGQSSWGTAQPFTQVLSIRFHCVPQAHRTFSTTGGRMDSHSL